MISISDYQLIELIYESINSLVYKGFSEKTNLPIIVKFLKQEYPDREEIIRYKQEFTITSSLSLDNIIKAYCLKKYQNTLAIIFEDFGGKSLDIHLKECDFTINKIIEIAIKITSGLEAIHRANIIHKDINSSNIVYNSNSEEIKIIDFGISAILPRENPNLKNIDEIEGTLSYISPEQTGRTNYFVDRRSDFYSLGVTLYEILTRQLPFTSEDSLELIHSHIALTPTPPQELNPKIPQVLSDIIMKLIEKNPEDRYQNASGLKTDLETCLQQINSNNLAVGFVLAQGDYNDRFEISQQLYGREKEINRLLKAFERIKSGDKEIIFVTGYAGAGKTTLVNEVRKLILQQRGYFVSGKFEQYKRDIPYSGFINAFENLIEQVLSETQVKVEIWKQKLLTALSNEGQLIIKLIPKLELIIGSQTPVLELRVNEAENRFNQLLQKFISVFAKKEHPLIIFLDDLQWTDSASLKLIKLLITNPESEHLLLIGTYRDNEVNSTHPLKIAYNELQKSILINTINLKPLKIEQIEQLINDSLNNSRSSVKDLAELLLNKTNGNPFFLNQLLQYLYQKKLILFNYKLKIWEWYIEEIETIGVTNNVIEITTSKINQLNEKSQNVLKLAACIGNTFNLKILSILNKKSILITAKELWPAIEEGLILPLDKNYKLLQLIGDSDRLLIETKELSSISYNFLHDRVQQAAYTLIPKAHKQQVHREVGQLFLQNIKAEELEENIFDIVSQLNIGKTLINQRSELDELAKLNLIAGKKAKSSAAYQIALKHLRIGIEILHENSWKSQYKLTLSLYLEAIEAAYLSGGNLPLINTWGQLVLLKAKSLLDCIKVYQIQILAHLGENNAPQAIETGLLILKKLGVNISNNPSKFKVLLELLWTRLTLRIKLTLAGKKIKDLIEVSQRHNSYKIAAINILDVLASPAYLFNPLVSLLVLLKTIQLSQKYGNNTQSALAYARYGTIIFGLIKDVDLAYEFIQLALNLSNKFKSKRNKNLVKYFFNAYIRHGREAANNSLPSLLECYEIARETNQLYHACLSLLVYISNSYFIGKELTSLEKEIKITINIIEKFKQETVLNHMKIKHQLLLDLINKEEKPFFLKNEISNVRKIFSLHEEGKDRTGIFYLYYCKLYLAYIFQEYEQALNCAKKIEPNIGVATTLFITCNFYFYDSLNRIALLFHNPQKYKYLLKKINSNQKQMQKWADTAPMNYQHKYNLVEAELYQFRKNQAKAANLYQLAIEGARDNEYLQEEALAYELAAKFYLGWNKKEIAKNYMIKALYKYQLWGAFVKVKHLEEKYPELLSENKIARSKSDYIITNYRKDTTRIRAKNIDAAIIIKTNRGISSEKDLDKVLEIILNYSLKAVGAELGAIILSEDGKDFIKGQAKLEGEEIVLLPYERISTTQEFPKSVINYVRNSRETILEKHASLQGKFMKEPYIAKRKTKSLLCLPLLSNGWFIGVIYLENNLSTDVFKEKDLDVLKLITTQAALSIENAILRKKESYTNGYYQLGVSLSADAPSYVQRDADIELYQNLRQGNYCQILNARQMGKSSLRIRITHKLKSLGYRCALVDISSVPTEQVTRGEWYEDFLAQLSENFSELDTPEFNNWLDKVSTLQPDRQFKYFIEKILLAKVKEHIIIFLEEVDSIRKLSFPLNDFFAQIRYFYNSRNDRPEFKRITFVFIGVTLPSDLVEDPNITPFNLGTKIRLSGLKLENTRPLIKGFEANCDRPQTVMKEILDWTGGQPFLTQRACSLVKRSKARLKAEQETESIANLLEKEMIINWQETDRGDHLKTIQKYIIKNKISPKNLLKLYKNIWLGKEVIFTPDCRVQQELLMIGLVKIEDNRLKIFNRIYRKIFNLNWLEKYLTSQD